MPVCGHRTRREHSLTKAAAPPEQHPHDPQAGSWGPEAKGVPRAAPKPWCGSGRARGAPGEEEQQDQPPAAQGAPPGHSERSKAGEGEVLGRSPHFCCWSLVLQTRLVMEGFAFYRRILSIQLSEEGAWGAEWEHGGDQAHLLLFFLFFFFFFFFTWQMLVFHARCQLRTHFFFLLFFFFLTRPFEKQRFDAKRCPDEMWEEPGLAAGECCYSSD